MFQISGLRNLMLVLLMLGTTMSWAGEKVIVTARLVEIPGEMPPNEIYNYVYIFKYKVLSVEQGTLDAKEILVGHYNPRIPRDQINDKMADKVKGSLAKLEAGDKHRLELEQPLTDFWNEAVEDEYFDDESVRWFAVKADKAN